MPELPDITVYVESLRTRVVGKPLGKATINSPFFLRTFDPPLREVEDKVLNAVSRMEKCIILEFDGDLFIVFHLMISGRLRWKDQDGAKLGGKMVLASFEFSNGTLFVTEGSKKKRASLHLVRGKDAIANLDPGGLEIEEANLGEFGDRLRLGNHTLKRALTDPKLFSGIGNAYSDEILNAAGLSPLALTLKLSDEEVEMLFQSTKEVFRDWTNQLRNKFAGIFPGAGEVTAFRPEFSAHGQFGNPCKLCGTTIQRIRYANNETNYCPTCQTGGKILSDRSLARLLKDDWPKSVEELEG
jgi:formamidopyrimidine-DNA glycosylase